MLSELSLNVLDIAQNSISAKATLIEILINISQKNNILEITIKDNGIGMTDEQIKKSIDPFFTTRNTRKIGLGLSFFKLATELADGSFIVTSELSKGTTVSASFVLSHINRMPLGDITETIHSLISCNENIDFVYTYTFNENSFTLDTREIKKMLGDISLSNPEVSSFIRDFLSENKAETEAGNSI